MIPTINPPTKMATNDYRKSVGGEKFPFSIKQEEIRGVQQEMKKIFKEGVTEETREKVREMLLMSNVKLFTQLDSFNNEMYKEIKDHIALLVETESKGRIKKEEKTVSEKNVLKEMMLGSVLMRTTRSHAFTPMSLVLGVFMECCSTPVAVMKLNSQLGIIQSRSTIIKYINDAREKVVPLRSERMVVHAVDNLDFLLATREGNVLKKTTVLSTITRIDVETEFPKEPKYLSVWKVGGFYTPVNEQQLLKYLEYYRNRLWTIEARDFLCLQNWADMRGMMEKNGTLDWVMFVEVPQKRRIHMLTSILTGDEAEVEVNTGEVIKVKYHGSLGNFTEVRHHVVDPFLKGVPDYKLHFIAGDEQTVESLTKLLKKEHERYAFYFLIYFRATRQ